MKEQLKCGLLGEKLGHSYSPQIHAALADYEYLLYEKAPEEVEHFVREGSWNGLNVTIPYKKTVIPFCDEVSELAQDIGSVNTLLRRADGSIYGDNTDAFGFETMLSRTDFQPEGKKVLVLGSGGASATVCAVLRRRGAQVIMVSRGGENNYQNLERHRDAAAVVNTTPLGMFPNNGKKALDLREFPALKAVLDVVYNPARTALMLQAEELGIPTAGGLTMLVAQGKRASEIFLGEKLPDTLTDRILAELRFEMQNIILIGMPGSGKSTVAGLLSEMLGRPLVEADSEIEKAAGKSIPQIFAEEGEEGFRKRETAVLEQFGKQSGIVLSTGGGCVTRAENYPLLHQNGTIVRITRDLTKLAREGRPLSQNADLQKMAEQREQFYRAFADITVANDAAPQETAAAILETIGQG